VGAAPAAPEGAPLSVALRLSLMNARTTACPTGTSSVLLILGRRFRQARVADVVPIYVSHTDSQVSAHTGRQPVAVGGASEWSLKPRLACRRGCHPNPHPGPLTSRPR